MLSHAVPLGQMSHGMQVLESRTLAACPPGPAWSSVWDRQLDRRKALVLKRGFPWPKWLAEVTSSHL